MVSTNLMRNYKEKEVLTMKKQRISLLISVFSLLFLMSACQGLDIEKEQIPGKQTSDAVPV